MERRKYVLPKKVCHDELFAQTKVEESGILIGVWDLVG